MPARCARPDLPRHTRQPLQRLDHLRITRLEHIHLDPCDHRLEQLGLTHPGLPQQRQEILGHVRVDLHRQPPRGSGRRQPPLTPLRVECLDEGLVAGLQTRPLAGLHQPMEIMGEEQLAQVCPCLAADRLHRRVEHIEIHRRQPRLDGLELLLARLADCRGGLRRDGHHRIAAVAHAHQDVPRHAQAVTERHVAPGVMHGDQRLATLAQGLAGVALEQDIHAWVTHW
ncbi:hypothetical protein WR25_00536 [Diploscapter pachys]|uniref:Uncharacterized protein n=1 Tax=Diploscapter pachys TaxID=2018661 RepID=A0A2A2KKY1_9BILA|nr:hypothetical protein WR25_00536 [Diploscapter pachys]